jgi:hypothetical protein
MKKIKLIVDSELPEVTLGNVTLQKGQRFTMKQYLNAKISNYGRFGGGKDNPGGDAQGLRISMAFNNANGSFTLEEADYTELKKCVEEVGLTPAMAIYGTQFKEAVLNAETVEMQEKGK